MQSLIIITYKLVFKYVKFKYYDFLEEVVINKINTTITHNFKRQGALIHKLLPSDHNILA